jgi:cell division septum initiation protein DivIVA
MAKKDKKASKKDKGREPADVVEAVRGAVERTFQATAGGTEGARDRGRSLLDDVASAAQRIRESFDDLRVLEDMKGLRTEIEALSKRVAELEKEQAAAPAAPAAAAKPAPARRAPARKPAAAKTTAARTTAAPKPADAPKPAAARKPPAKATAKPSAAGTAAKTTGPKPKPTPARRKPAAPRTTPSGGS